MKVKELIEKLQKLNQEKEITIKTENREAIKIGGIYLKDWDDDNCYIIYE